MNKLIVFFCLTTACLAQNFQVDKNFIANDFLLGPWYEVAYWNNQTDNETIVCSLLVLTNENGNGTWTYQFSYRNTIDQPREFDSAILRPTNTPGLFEATDVSSGNRSFVILAHAHDYSWIIFGDSWTDNGIISLMSRSLGYRRDAVAVGARFAAQYGYKKQNDSQDPRCQWAETVNILAERR